MARHVLGTISKIKEKEKNLKTAREKQQFMYKGNLMRLSADFSAEILKCRRKWHDIFKGLKGKTLQPRILY